ncbi:MAG: ATP-dependent Clp protease adaptor ClpS [Defluviitaleaceae bacterium]|nr:ATP-dependent Clp protease adaptor ClpS [Defluviitaleaceae bacterium]MCL2275030.1 ATP-dependent Clp protease adaptor ClpS [Defluviitaleaceae bacterium]
MSTLVHTHTDHETKLRMPHYYAVIIHNDDVTSMDFVVEMLVKVFHKSTVEASDLMMEVHNVGHGIAGVYTYDIAVTKKYQAERRASEKGFPLRLTLWEVEQ